MRLTLPLSRQARSAQAVTVGTMRPIVLAALVIALAGCAEDRLPTPQQNPQAAPPGSPSAQSTASLPSTSPSPQAAFCAPLREARTATGEIGLDPTKRADGLAAAGRSYDEAAMLATGELREAFTSFAAAVRAPSDRLAYDRAQFQLEQVSAEVEELCGEGSL